MGRDALGRARLGDRGEDASVNALCERAAALLGKADAVWVPTCGMANLVAMLTFCERGDVVVLESASHVLTSEAMGLVEVAGLEPRSLWAADGRLDPDAVDELVRQTRAVLLILENTHTRAGGRPLSAELTGRLAAAREASRLPRPPRRRTAGQRVRRARRAARVARRAGQQRRPLAQQGPVGADGHRSSPGARRSWGGRDSCSTGWAARRSTRPGSRPQPGSSPSTR